MINVTCRINLNRKWDINQQEVFSKINIFKQRCYDVIEICEALIVFGRYLKEEEKKRKIEINNRFYVI